MLPVRSVSPVHVCVISGAFVEEKPSSTRPELGLKKKGLRGGDAAVGGDDDGRCVDVDCHRLPLCQQHRESHNKIAATPSAFLETSTWILEAIAYHFPRAPAPLDPCCCPPPESAWNCQVDRPRPAVRCLSVPVVRVAEAFTKLYGT